ncbi:acyltransferase domain-containing protein, partial [Kitasatospora sp. NPDC048538]|uniref:acyltransferase domain-containing protein n=1 Tax=unclassified Kitasatospora TaxID=2633591 RepID=UPI0034090F6A
EHRAWPATGRPRRGAVSSFGISGTNAHLILEEPTADEPVEPVEVPGPYVWQLSARDDTALRAQARRLADHLHDQDVHPAEVAHALATTRTTFDHRAAVILRTPTEAHAALTALAEGHPHPALVTGTATTTGTRPVYLYPGQGSHHPGTGRHLYQTFPAYAQAIDDLTDAFRPHLDHPLRDLLHAEPDTPTAALLDQTHYAQPAIFALGTALTHLLTHHDIHPTAVLGHSIGALTAAHTAGILTLHDAATLVTTRARLMQQAPHTGTMTAIQATPEEALHAITGHEHLVSLAAVNSPTSIVLSGDHHTLTHITDHFHTQGRRTKPLTVSHAFHSPHMDPILDEFHTA